MWAWVLVTTSTRKPLTFVRVFDLTAVVRGCALLSPPCLLSSISVTLFFLLVIPMTLCRYLSGASKKAKRPDYMHGEKVDTLET
jgi:hypothetical protein